MNELTSEEISLLIKAIDSIEKARKAGRAFEMVEGLLQKKKKKI